MNAQEHLIIRLKQCSYCPIIATIFLICKKKIDFLKNF